jgi:hypothetical protein
MTQLSLEAQAIGRLTAVMTRVADALETIAERMPQPAAEPAPTIDEPTSPNPQAPPQLGRPATDREMRELLEVHPGLQQRPPIR